MSTEPGTWHHGLVARYWATFVDDGPEIAYYRSVIERHGEPALDVGCGTGRLLLPYRRDGMDVDGVDVSADMIALCREAAATEGLEATLHVQALHELDVPRTYRTIVGCGVFGIGSTRAQDRAALERLRGHLEPGGTLVIDHEMPYSGDARPWPYWTPAGQARLRDGGGSWNGGERERAPDGSDFVLRGRIADVDPLHQVTTYEIHAQRWEGDTLVEEERRTLTINVYLANELRLLLEATGFEVVSVTGDWSDEPATRHHATLVFTARAV